MRLFTFMLFLLVAFCPQRSFAHVDPKLTPILSKLNACIAEANKKKICKKEVANELRNAIRAFPMGVPLRSPGAKRFKLSSGFLSYDVDDERFARLGHGFIHCDIEDNKIKKAKCILANDAEEYIEKYE